MLFYKHMTKPQPMYDPYKSLHENLYHKSGYDFLGQRLNSLFGLAACPATMNSAYCRAAFSNGFDIVTYKTQRSVRFPANPFPNVLQIEFKGN